MINKLLDILYENGNKILYKINSDNITYKNCYDKVLELSDNLKKQGNEPIIVYGHKSIDMFISILSCVVSRRCYIPIDTYIPVDRLEKIIEESNSSLIIKNEKLDIDTDIECLDIGNINKKYSNIKDYYDIDNNYVYIIFTSGSTGIPKGVPITYDNLNNFIKWISRLNEFSKCENINVLSQASYSFDLSVMDIYFSLFKNCIITALDNTDDINNIYNVIKDNNINFLIMTPTFIKLLLLDKSFNQDNYKCIEYMFFCGEVLEVETVRKIKERFKNVKVINAYGPTEATCCVSLTEITDDMLNKDILPVGRVSTSCVDIIIKDSEIILKGDSVSFNYLNVNSNNFYKDNNINCYKTGDVGYIDNDYLYCKGRIDNQIKYLGYRIDLSDIENNLLKIDGVLEAVVVASYSDNNIVKLLKCFITLEKDITIDKIKKELSKLVPKYMVPKNMYILDKIPVNNNGKYDRKKLINYDKYL